MAWHGKGKQAAIDDSISTLDGLKCPGRVLNHTVPADFCQDAYCIPFIIGICFIVIKSRDLRELATSSFALDRAHICLISLHNSC